MRSKKFALAFSVFTIISLSTAIAVEQPAQIFERTVASFNKTQLSQYHQLKTDCTALGKVVVRITAQPKNGSAEVEEGEVVPNIDKDSIYFSCNGKKVTGSRLIYTSAENFVGKDSIEIEAFFPQGSSRKEKYIITVK